MKRFFILFFVVLLLIVSGCTDSQNKVVNNSEIKVEGLSPILPETNTSEPVVEPEDDEEKKKRYAVSLVNSLRLRSASNGSSETLGYLDKYDAVLILGESGNYFKTVYKEKEAYVFSDYCSVMEIDCGSEEVESAIDLGCSLLGYPYVWGSQRYHWGNGKLNTSFVMGEFDCSALVQYVFYKSNSVIMDLTSRTQVNNGKEVKLSELKRGDVMFFTNSSRKNKVGTERIGHVGIYFGNNYILHTASDHAVIEPISDVRWDYYITSRRVV